jgi:hypothetical protein
LRIEDDFRHEIRIEKPLRAFWNNPFFSVLSVQRRRFQYLLGYACLEIGFEDSPEA